jgi:hypothetical protein
MNVWSSRIGRTGDENCRCQNHLWMDYRGNTVLQPTVIGDEARDS